MLALYLLCVTPILIFALTGGGLDLFGRIAMIIIFAFLLSIAVFGVLAWGWRLTFNPDDAECVFRRTYLGYSYHSVSTSLADGPIGSCPVRITWEERPRERGMALVYVVLFFLGLIGALISGLIYLSKKKVLAANDYPGIIHYSDSTDLITVLLALDKPSTQKRILDACTELAPAYVGSE